MTGGLVGQLQDEYNAGGGLTAQERRDLDQQVLGMGSGAWCCWTECYRLQQNARTTHR